MTSVADWLATGPLSGLTRPLHRRLELMRWKMDPGGRPAPHSVKERIVRQYAAAYGLRTLVETGTYLGDMIAAVRRDFSEIHSIELDDGLYERARTRFKNDAAVHLYRGDSAEVLPGILARLTVPALFWLDAHFSGGITARGAEETPVLRELDQTLRAAGGRHVVLIDDARRFSGESGYPSIERVELRIGSLPFDLSVADDVIRIVPRGDAAGRTAT